MSILKEQFDRARVQIMDLSAHVYKKPIIDILDQLYPDHRTKLDMAVLADKLEKEDIDADAFLETWAVGYAKKTVNQTNISYVHFAQVNHTRCLTCLDETDDLAFGKRLPVELKQKVIERKQELEQQFPAFRHGA